jgi:hypothetical protein
MLNRAVLDKMDDAIDAKCREEDKERRARAGG